jgi:hypothetical protein
VGSGQRVAVRAVTLSRLLARAARRERLDRLQDIQSPKIQVLFDKFETPRALRRACRRDTGCVRLCPLGHGQMSQAGLRRDAPLRGASTRFPGGYRSRATPVPIPNTEVKPATADGTARATLWESRSLPGVSRGPTSSHDGVGRFSVRAGRLSDTRKPSRRRSGAPSKRRCRGPSTRRSGSSGSPPAGRLRRGTHRASPPRPVGRTLRACPV